MLQTEKTKNLMDHINRIIRRMEHIKEVKTQLFDFVTEAQELYSSFSQKIHKEMIVFQDKIVKTSLYSAQKTSYIINLAKVYRQFSIQLQKNSKINLINMQRIKNDDIVKQQQRLKKKCEFFQKQFEQYLQAQKNYNYNFNIYSNKCNDLDQIIRRYRSYQDPIAFYNQILTNQYVRQLDKQYNDCSNFETTVVNDTQRLDQTRKWMGEHIKQINQYYVILLHFYLGIIESIITCIVDPKKDQSSQKNRLDLRNSELGTLDRLHNEELNKLDNLYSSQLNNKKHLEDNIIEQYSELFNKSFAQNELNSDYKFFYDRCENIRNKKLKTTNEVFTIQMLLLAELKTQKNNHNNFQLSFRQTEKDIFTNNGVESFKKRFRKYFGPNFTEIQQLCFVVIERQKKSLDRIGKSTEQMELKLGKLLQNKNQSIKLFEKRTKMILDDHLKLKEKTYSNHSVDTQILKKFKESIAQSFNQLKKSFMQLQKNESQVDKLFFTNLKAHYQIIIKQSVNKNLSKILEKQKNRLNILQVLNVDSEIVIILKEDTRYENLMNECPKPNLYSTFQSLAKKKEYDETKKLLQMKENRLKNLIRPKQGCCGITSEPIKHNVLSEHKCKLIIGDKKQKGILNITSTGLIYEEITWNPFSDALRLMIPSNDINSFDTKVVNEKESIQISTDFGNLIFESKLSTQIIESMQKNITFKPIREVSQKGGKRNDSSSFIKNNTSTEYKLSFDNKTANNSGSKLQTKNEKHKTKGKTTDSIINDFLRKWREANFLSQHFIRIHKDLPETSSSRKDYSYNNGHKFVLKERSTHKLQGKDIILQYEWKVCFPDTPLLHSFKHNQKVYIQSINKDLQIRIVTDNYHEQQLFIRNKFYKQIEDMNNKLNEFIVQTLEKQANILIEPENANNNSMESCDILLDQINLEQKESKHEKGQNTLRNSRLERQKSTSFITTK